MLNAPVFHEVVARLVFSDALANTTDVGLADCDVTERQLRVAVPAASPRSRETARAIYRQEEFIRHVLTSTQKHLPIVMTINYDLHYNRFGINKRFVLRSIEELLFKKKRWPERSFVEYF